MQATAPRSGLLARGLSMIVTRVEAIRFPPESWRWTRDQKTDGGNEGASDRPCRRRCRHSACACTRISRRPRVDAGEARPTSTPTASIEPASADGDLVALLPVHRLVGPRHEHRLVLRSVPRRDAGRGAVLAAQAGGESRNDVRGSRCVGALEDDRELVAAEAPEHVALAERCRPTARDLPQQAIAGSVTALVVHAFQAVDVERDDTDRIETRERPERSRC